LILAARADPDRFPLGHGILQPWPSSQIGLATPASSPSSFWTEKVDNHKAALALHFMHYNFARVHKTLRVTPAMEAGVADHVWSLEEMAGLAD